MFRELSPIEAFTEMGDIANAVLIDCRTPAEWHLTGTPDLSSLNKQVALIPLSDETGRPNPDFIEKVGEIASEDVPLLLLCRVGGRSANACNMLASAGYTNLANILEGFEGRADDNGHRNSFEGWKFHQLPWRQN